MDHEATFHAAIREYGHALRRIARVYGTDGDEEDLHQEILVEIWRGLLSFRGDSSLGTWMYRVALNTGLKHQRKSKRQPRFATTSADIPSASLSDGDREARILRDYLAGLGSVDRAVLLLYMDGLSHSDIGDVTGLSVTAVGVRIHRLKQAFKQRFLE